ncbi:MAG: hypothetical protein QM817_29000 [Archangium sp.]
MQPKLGEWLVGEHLITRAQLDAGLQAQLMYGGRFGTNLVELGLMQDNALALALSRYARVPEATREMLDDAQDSVVRAFKPDWAKKFCAFPFRQDEQRRVHVAILDPHEPAVIDGLSFTLGARVVPYVVTELRLWHSLHRWYGLKREFRYIRLQPDENELRALGLDPAQVAKISNATPPPGAMKTPTLVRERMRLFGTVDDMEPTTEIPGATPVKVSGSPTPRTLPSPSDLAASAVKVSNSPTPRTLPSPGDLAASAVKVSGSPTPRSLPVSSRPPTPLPAGKKQTLPPGAMFVSSSPSGLTSTADEKKPPSAMAETALNVARQVVPRAMIFAECFGTAVFWRGEGEASDSSALRALRFDLTRPSLFARAAHDRAAQTVVMPPGEEDQRLFAALGGPHEYAMAFPVMRRGEPVFFLYIDCGRSSVPTSVITSLTRMTQSMSAALTV